MKSKEQELIPTRPAKAELVQADGTLNPAAYMSKPDERLQAFRRLFPQETYNVVLFSEFLLSKIPPGAAFYPQMIECSAEDFWDASNAPEIGLKKDHVEVSARFVSKIGQAAGVQLEKVVDHEIVVDGQPALEILYVARLRLPDGTLAETPPIGKTQMLKTSSGKTQAHIRESTDAKARRNAIKDLLAIPTQMHRDLAKRIWVAVKVVHDPDSPQGRAVTSRAELAKSMLYPATEIEPPPTAGPDVDRIREEIKSATTIDAVKEITSALDFRSLDEKDADSIRGLYGRRVKELSDRELKS